jgi:putative DNA primase/helicase
LQYIILNADKTPAEKLADGGHALKEVEGFDNLGVLIPEPYIVLDFDTKSDAEIMLRIAQELDLKCLIMKTTRGYHFWFKSPEPWKNFRKTRLAIGIYADCRSWGKHSYTVVKKDGQWREWIKVIPGEEIEEVPCWLRPLSTNERFSFKSMKDGDGRNQALFEYILIMQSKGYNREQIRKTLRIINNFVFAEPLSEEEVNVVFRDEAFKDEEEIQDSIILNECFDEDGKFKHDKFAEHLVQLMNIVTVNEQCYVYKDGYYQRAEREIDKEMIRLYPRSKRAQRSEVLDYIKILTTIRSSDIPLQEYIINVKNGRLDVRTETLLPHDSEILDFTQLPVVYDPEAYCPDLDKTLNRVFKHDRQVIDLFEEMVGYLLIKNCRFRKGFLFYGGGSNGKSTILNLLKKFIGENNLATVELKKLSDPFLTAELEHKLANIGDDIDPKEVTDTGTIKKLFTGESMTVQRKYQDPFIMKNYAKMIFSCNQLPRIIDKSYGMYSRLMLIPFTATFTANDEDFDPFIEDKITTDEALSYLLNIGLRGLRRLLHNNRFTEPKVVIDALEKYKTSNSTVLTWIEEEGIETKELLGQPTDKLFSQFKDWCTRSEIKYQSSIRTFHKDIEEKYNFERIRRRKKENWKNYEWVFVVKLE